MNGSNFRSQLRTNIPGDTRISGRFNDVGTVLEGKKFTVSTAGGVHTILFGTSATDLTPVKGLVAAHAICVVASPSITAVQSVVVKSITTNASGAVTGAILVTTTAAGATTALASGDMVCFEFTVRDTEVLV